MAGNLKWWAIVISRPRALRSGSSKVATPCSAARMEAGSKGKRVSSISSRIAQATSFSPRSRWPPGTAQRSSPKGPLRRTSSTWSPTVTTASPVMYATAVYFFR